MNSHRHTGIYVDKGGYVEEKTGDGSPVFVPFPICLAIKYGENVAAECPDFVLNVAAGWVFIHTDSPLPEGSPVLLHFYIPPEDKLLAEVRGTVDLSGRQPRYYPVGMRVKFSLFSRAQLKGLEQYLDQEKPLIDKQA